MTVKKMQVTVADEAVVAQLINSSRSLNGVSRPSMTVD
jgi:hypothetical protein